MVFLLQKNNKKCKKIIKKCGPKGAKSTSLFSRTKIIFVHLIISKKDESVQTESTHMVQLRHQHTCTR